jgi:hypothetical protein
MRLIKPKFVGKLKSKYEKDETELQTITSSLMRKSTNVSYQFKMNKKIENIIKEDYF